MSSPHAAHHHSAAPHAAKSPHQKTPAGEPAPYRREATLSATVVRLWPYVWSDERRDLQVRVVAAFFMLLIAKVLTILIPYSFKWVTDAIVSPETASVPLPALLATPVAICVLYGLLRSFMQFFTQARDALFASVAMHAVRRMANEVFVHLHELSLRFHLERKTGGLTRVLERGREAIQQIVRMSILTGIPTIVEFALILGVFFFAFDWRYALTVVVMIALYLWFTRVATDWRIQIRRNMNESDTDANVKAIDSLLNYETVKYFGAEKREAERYDRSMERYERNSVSSYVSLAVLNSGQGFIFSMALMVVMILCVIDIREGRNTIGDFVLLNGLMIQLYQPLNFMGMVYREVKQAIIDMHFMLQKEVVDRIAALPGSKAYGRLSIVMQYHCDVECLFIVPPESFFPAPKVDSAILRLTPHRLSPYAKVCTKTLQDVVALAFGMRRKTLANNLKPLLYLL
jgi:ATP-binding cassette subfamily B protein